MSALLLPAHIDALLMQAALDREVAVLAVGGLRCEGRLDLPQGFAEITFVPRQRGGTAGVQPGAQVVIALETGDQTLRFTASVLVTSAARLRLRRPRRVECTAGEALRATG